jgi:hypothetical protein
MNAPIPFNIRVPDVDPSRLISLEGADGPFYVAEIGYRPEDWGDVALFYIDGRFQFCFYSSYKWLPPLLNGVVPFDIEIIALTAERFRGHFVGDIPAPDLKRIKENIERLFGTREPLLFGKPISAKYVLHGIAFNWRVYVPATRQWTVPGERAK